MDEEHMMESEKNKKNFSKKSVSNLFDKWKIHTFQYFPHEYYKKALNRVKVSPY